MTQLRRLLYRGALGLISIIGSLIPGGMVEAGSYPPTTTPPNIPIPGLFDPSISTSPSQVTAGSNFTVTVTPCVRDTLIPMTFEGRTINALCTNPHAKATFRAPAKAGTYPLTVRAYIRTIRFDVVVVGGSDGDFPSTGISKLPLTLTIGTSALVTGLGLYAVSRRRRRNRLVT